MKDYGVPKSAQECNLLRSIALAVRILKCRVPVAWQPEFARRRAIYSGAIPGDSL